MLKRFAAPMVLLWVLVACDPSGPPQVAVTVSPLDGAENVAVTAVVTADFNVAMNETTVEGAFTLSSSAGEVAGVLAYDATLRRATFTPSTDLAYDTEYTAAVAGTIRSAAGGRIPIPTTGEYAWSFTTESDPDVPPAVTAVVVSPSTAVLEVAGTQQFDAAVTAVGGASTDVTWSSDDTDVATVDEEGLVTAVARGTATITATSVAAPSVSGPATVTVVQPDPFSFAAVSDAVPGAIVTSAAATLSGLTAPAAATLSGSGASLLVNGVVVDSGALVEAGDTIAIQLTASEAYDTTVTATATIAGVSATFSVTTLSPPLAAPSITSFSTDPETVRAGSTILLQWTIAGVADEVIITNDRGLPQVDASGENSTEVGVPGDRPTITFTLTATNTDTGENDSEELVVDLELWVCTDDADPITITDPTLRGIIRAQLILAPEVAISCTDMRSITSINTGHYDENPGDIASLEGLQHAINLVNLDAQYNEIDDASPVAGLTDLQVINFDRNEIVDLEPFRNLLGLRELGLWDNGPIDGEGDDGIDDLEPLNGLTNLETLYLSSNNISDLSPLSGLVNLELLWVMNNRILDLGPVAELTALRSFRVGWNQGDEGTGFARITDVSPLTGLPDLAWLGLEWAAISDTTPLSTLPSLYATSLEGNRLTSVSDLVANADFPLIPVEPLPFAPADPTLNIIDNCLDTTPLSPDSVDIATLETRGIVVLGFDSGQQGLCPEGGDAIDGLRERSLQEMQRTDGYR